MGVCVNVLVFVVAASVFFPFSLSIFVVVVVCSDSRSLIKQNLVFGKCGNQDEEQYGSVCSYGINRLAHTYYNENNNDNNNKPNHKLTIQFTLVTMLARSLIQFLMLKWETKFYLFVHAVHHSAIMAFFICKVRWSKSTMNNRISVIYFISIFIFLAVFVSFTCFLFVNNQLKALCATRYRKRSYYIFF